jgi:hypothetical protein
MRTTLGRAMGCDHVGDVPDERVYHKPRLVQSFLTKFSILLERIA